MNNEIKLLYQHIVTLNNEGVAWLYTDRANALSFFRAALESMRSLLGCFGVEAIQPPTCQIHHPHGYHHPPQQNGLPFPAMPTNMARSPPPPSSPTPGQPLPHDLQRHQPQVPSLIDNVFVRAFHLIGSADGAAAYSQDPLTNISVAFAIVLFNMAIAFHWQALHEELSVSSCSPDPNTHVDWYDCLTRAKLLYHKAQFILNKLGITNETACGHAVIDLVTMASLNNLAQLCQAFEDRSIRKIHATTSSDYAEENQDLNHREDSSVTITASQRFGRQLLAFCATVVPAQHDVDTASILRWYMSAFQLHAQLLQIPTMASAA